MVKKFPLFKDDIFNFDADKMLADFNVVKEKYPEKVSFMLTFLTPESAEIMDNLHDRTYIKSLYPPEAFKNLPALFKMNMERLSMANFHVALRGSYTHQILNQIDEELRKEGKRISYVEYHELIPAKCYPIHSDMTEFKWHIPIKTNDKAFLIVEDGANTRDYGIYEMDQVGKVHIFPTTTLHTAVNGGMESRIHLIMDIVAI